jgi:hypothetical protein
MLTALRTYNIGVREELSSEYPTLQLGFFNGGDVLFIGQNPGMPYIDRQENDLHRLSQAVDYNEYEHNYEAIIYGSKIGSVVKQIIGNDWSTISFTNVVKVQTAGNTIPEQSLIDIFTPILGRQIELLNPKTILCFGKFAGQQFDIIDFYTTYRVNESLITMIQHPSFILRTGQLDEYVKTVKMIIK